MGNHIIIMFVMFWCGGNWICSQKQKNVTPWSRRIHNNSEVVKLSPRRTECWPCQQVKPETFTTCRLPFVLRLVNLSGLCWWLILKKWRKGRGLKGHKSTQSHFQVLRCGSWLMPWNSFYLLLRCFSKSTNYLWTNGSTSDITVILYIHTCCTYVYTYMYVCMYIHAIRSLLNCRKNA